MFSSNSNANSAAFIEQAIRFAATPSLECLAAFVEAFVTDSEKRKKVIPLVFGSYNEWLQLWSTKADRDHLTDLQHTDTIWKDPVFARIRDAGREFSKGLELLFFDFDRERGGNEVAGVALQYIGF